MEPPQSTRLPIEHTTGIATMAFTRHTFMLWARHHRLLPCDLSTHADAFGMKDYTEVSELLTDDYDCSNLEDKLYTRTVRLPTIAARLCKSKGVTRGVCIRTSRQTMHQSSCAGTPRDFLVDSDKSGLGVYSDGRTMSKSWKWARVERGPYRIGCGQDMICNELHAVDRNQSV